ncbi:MAG: hypothetical protein M1827_003284 [Pycnora praestabilis]|nr:MAG: hypothetical protein M1827_003284 [Pycnora praestabilis]
MLRKTEPPVLSPDHPIRKAFYQHGTSAARHPVLHILISVVIGIVLCYPFPYLYSSPTAGSSNLPHHVWTSARPYEGPPTTQPAAEIRQVWVHGSYMRALDKDVLSEALSIQRALFGPLLDESPTVSLVNEQDKTEPSLDPDVLGLSTLREHDKGIFIFHSPLLYWNYSSASIASDQHILRTINQQATRTSPFNITLRHSTVFAGKSFVNRELIEADALVITIVCKVGSDAGLIWDARAAELSESGSERWSLFPKDGKSSNTELYEFRFQPMSLQDDLFLALAYLIMAIYVMLSLRKLRAVRSRFGLVLTGVAKITISVLSSFTICAIFKINLSQMPREAYPFVIFTVGLENMFRLINAVLATPLEMPTIFRIANALGDTGHLTLAAAGQNLTILWLLSKVVSPGVSAFCAYAAVALVFDFFYHLMFFVAVLSVDVRRMELQDSLDRVDFTPLSARSIDTSRQTWGGALLKGKLPFSTRIAGTAVMTSFVTSLNWHFFDNESPVQLFTRLLPHLSWRGGSGQIDTSSTVISLMNQAKTPKSWLRMQDHATAKEIIGLIKPHGHSLITRVYEPLIFVLHGADRGGNLAASQHIMKDVLEHIRHHLFPFTLAMVMTIAAVTLLMNYLLWNETVDEDNEQTVLGGPVLSVKSLTEAHSLDIAMLTACPKGILVSVALDRSISLWIFNSSTGTFHQQTIQTSRHGAPLWPISAIAIEDGGQSLAICSNAGHISSYHLPERKFTHFAKIDLAGQQICSFCFCPSYCDGFQSSRLVALRKDGLLIEVDVLSNQSQLLRICKSPLLSAKASIPSKEMYGIFAISRSGGMHLATRDWTKWTSIDITISDGYTKPDSDVREVKAAVSVAGLNMILVVQRCEVLLVDLYSRNVIRTFQTGQVRGQTLRPLHSRPRPCASCGALALASFSFAYTEQVTQKCIMHTWLPNEVKSPICLHVPKDSENKICAGFEGAHEALHWVENVDVWEVTRFNSIIGVRKRPPVGKSVSSHSAKCGSSAPSGLIRRRKAIEGRSISSFTDTDDQWEAWMLSATGEFHTNGFTPDRGQDRDTQLLISKAGPICTFGNRSVALALSTTVKVVTIGTERFEDGLNGVGDVASVGVGHRRRIVRIKSQ